MKITLTDFDDTSQVLTLEAGKAGDDWIELTIGSGYRTDSVQVQVDLLRDVLNFLAPQATDAYVPPKETR